MEQGEDRVFKGYLLDRKCRNPEILVDYFMEFDKKKHTSLFVSHCHTDHIEGLDQEEIYRQIQGKIRDSKCSLYATSETIAILMEKKYLKHLKSEDFTELAVGRSFRFGEGNRTTVQVLPADHCPGSVMLLKNVPHYS